MVDDGWNSDVHCLVHLNDRFDHIRTAIGTELVHTGLNLVIAHGTLIPFFRRWNLGAKDWLTL